MLKGHNVVFDEEIHTQEFNINEVITQTQKYLSFQ